MKTTGKFRISFNRHAARPLVWSVQVMGAPDRPQSFALDSAADAPIFEVAVRGVGFDRVVVETMYLPNKATPDDVDGKPSAWLEATGELEVLADGCAVIRAVAA